MQEKLVQFRTKHPILTAVIAGELLMALAHLMELLFIPLSSILPLVDHPYLGQLLFDLIAFAMTCGVIHLLKMRHVVTNSNISFLKGTFLIGGYFILISIFCFYLSLSDNLSSHAGLQPAIDIVFYVLAMVAVGLFEETTYRGLVLNILLTHLHKTKKGIYLAVVCSGLIFGSMHLFNIIEGAAPFSILIQVASASILGMYLAAVYLRSGKLSVVIFLHALFDFANLLTSGIFSASTLIHQLSGYSILTAIGTIPYVIAVIILLRPSKIDEIIERYNKLD